ncbi:hypothetical protein JG687_00018567 [Phytophthora cactorum]|uniref:Uncharacterized protein n=1 Tax=Phytophthora cactorum TaxID=29920 RepID=A0A329SUY2_9STRA|nr:hypothetical protein Pcac1_g8216 [Phytophthora cactorum]KAG2801886.1 hypothetical protein PC111_g19350 [Phytophthora cactorum]KAG2809416.1 hypothetical protein PC112_g16516 [Phytophthora cactorum]KAG2816942.1 hypothetical protein PC113_g23029 [Phytophthora cactorum]KAG2873393.1 hypothetical protein PC114_g25881 [Phytophthora cactorum]
MTPPLQLKIVALVLSKLSSHPIDSVAVAISDFLVADLSLSKALELSYADSLALLDLVWARSLGPIRSSRWSATNLLQTKDYYYKWEFSIALVKAIRRADLNQIQWLLGHLSDCPVVGTSWKKLPSWDTCGCCSC